MKKGQNHKHFVGYLLRHLALKSVYKFRLNERKLLFFKISLNFNILKFESHCPGKPKSSCVHGKHYYINPIWLCIGFGFPMESIITFPNHYLRGLCSSCDRPNITFFFHKTNFLSFANWLLTCDVSMILLRNRA